MPKKRADVSTKLEAIFKLIHKCELENVRNALQSQAELSVEDLVKASVKKNGDYLVTVAARHGRLDVLTYLKDECGASLEVANHDGKRPLHEAAQFGRVDCVSYLIQAGAEVDALKRATWTPLMLACTKDNLDVLQTLIEQGGATYDDLKNKDGWTAFHIACREGHVDILRYFLQLKPRLWDTRSNVARTPLHTAALNGKIDAVQLLLDSMNPKDINCRDVCGATPLTDAIKGGHANIVTLLLEAQSSNRASILNVEYDSLGRLPLDIAAMFGNLDIFLSILEATVEASVKAPTPSLAEVLMRSSQNRERTPLHYAALEGHEQLVQWIVYKLRTEIDSFGDGGGTVDYRRRILCLDTDGKTPLDFAIRGQHHRCVEILSESDLMK